MISNPTLIFTDRLRSTREGIVYTGEYLPLHRGGGDPISIPQYFPWSQVLDGGWGHTILTWSRHPPPVGTGWGYHPIGTGWVYPPPPIGTWTDYAAVGTPLEVSRRRTSLFYSVSVLAYASCIQTTSGNTIILSTNFFI